MLIIVYYVYLGKIMAFVVNEETRRMCLWMAFLLIIN
jgi:hypothetical protein